MTGSAITPSRRGVLAGGGSLVLGFALLSDACGQELPAGAAAGKPKRPGSLADEPSLDAWIRIDANGGVTVFTGKAELGQGVRTALVQIAAEELEVDPIAIRLVTADTGSTPDEGYTAGSQSIQYSGTAIRHAAAQVREILIAGAAARWQVPAGDLRAESGQVVRGNGETLGYGTLVSSDLLHVDAAPQSNLKTPDRYRVIGQPMHRVDIPAKVTGTPAYVHDMRPPGMLHARVVRPPLPGATLVSLDGAVVERLPGVVAVVRNGSFLAVVTEREFQAVQAMQALQGAARWSGGTRLPRPAGFTRSLKGRPTQEGVVAERGQADVTTDRTFRATFTRPYQVHGSIGPSCALAVLENGQTTVWSHTQGVFPTGRPSRRCFGFRPSGCGWCMPRARVATAIMVPTMPRRTRRSSPRPCRAVRSACNGCASRSTSGNPMVRRC